MRILILSLLFCLSIGAQAQNCKSIPSIVSDLNGEIDRVMNTLGGSIVASAPILDDVAKYRTLTTKMISFWNKKSGSRGWSTIGPRRLEFGKAETGKIVSTAGRMYLSAAPANKRVLNVTITELDGKGKTAYTVCRINYRGEYVHIKTGYFNQTSAAKKNGKEKHTFEVKRMKGCLLSVNFDGKSVGNTFQYRVKAENKF